MQEVIAAIISHFDSDATLATLVPNGIWLSISKDSTALPTAQLSVTRVEAEWQTGTCYIETLHVDFHVFDQTGMDTLNIIEAVEEAFDWTTFTFDEGTLIASKRVTERIFKEDDRVFHGILSYEIIVQKDLLDSASSSSSTSSSSSSG